MKLECCRPTPACKRFCRLDGHLIVGQGVISNPDNGWTYEVLNVLARGGMSITYLVYNYQTRRLGVLKEIDTELAKKAKARELFQREARVLKMLQHPGIPRFHDFFFTNDRYTLVMELIHGLNLEIIPKPSPVTALRWMIELTDILDYLHRQDPPVIHRDIKPANLILRYNPRQIVLIDFGAVKEATSVPGTRISTLGFGAPEQQRGRPCLQSDFYALGATLIYLFTHCDPSRFYDLARMQFTGLPEDQVPAAAVPVIQTLTAYNPAMRPANTRAAKFLLEQCLEQLEATGNATV